MRLGVEAALVGSTLVQGDVEVADGLVAAVGLSSPNGTGIAAPGFVDLQVNGFAGVDFLDADADAEAYARVGDALLSTGVTSYLPTLITAPADRLVAALTAVPRESSGPRILGVHLEGPFISPERLGAHPARFRTDPDPALLARLLDAGPVRLVTLAPELPGALALVDILRERGVSVSCGHTDATVEEASAAFDRGARSVTHLFNAMRPFSHRDPGIVGAALTRADVVVQLIVDGVHLAPETVELVLQSAGTRLALVTDAMAGAGLGDGTFALGDVQVEVKSGVAQRSDGVLAGSVLTMIDAVRNLHRLGATLEQALTAASTVPAQVLGSVDVGRLEPGARADIVVLGDDLSIEQVLVGGKTLVAC